MNLARTVSGFRHPDRRVGEIFHCLVFLSGVTALMYEVVWTRLFADILGSTAFSLTAVFSVFLFFLAFGAWLAGRIRATGKKALLLYGIFEVAISLTAAVTSVLLVVGRFRIAGYLAGSHSFAAAQLIHVSAACLLMGPPALLMGATFPVMLNAAKGWIDPRQAVSPLYGWNTLGGACGALAPGFFLIWCLGISKTLMVAVFLNLAVGCTALVSLRFLPSETLPFSSAGESKGWVADGYFSRFAWNGLSFLGGFGSLAFEILWARMARFLLGDRTMAVSLLLFIYIGCLGLGAIAAPWVREKWRATSGRKVLQLISVVLISVGWLHLFFAYLAWQHVSDKGFLPVFHGLTDSLGFRVFHFGLLVSMPVVVSGLAFPLLAWSDRRLAEKPGQTIGSLLFYNTCGALLGIVSATFFLSRWLGSLTGFLAVAGLVILAGFVVLVASVDRWWKKGLALAMLLFLIPVGYFYPPSLVALRDDEVLLQAAEDEYGVQVLVQTRGRTIRLRNNRLHLVYELGSPQTAYAQQMAAHLSVLLARECREILNLGTGYGITAGTFTLFEDVRSIETVEILPFIVRSQGYFFDQNFAYLKDPRVNLILADGRHYLQTSPKSYDIITVNVLDPYLPGSSSLYTIDFWKTARDRLNPGGVFQQLLWGRDIPLLVKGLETVFPTLLLFPAYGGSAFNVVAFAEPLQPSHLPKHLERFGTKTLGPIRNLTGMEPRLLFPALVEEARKIHRTISRAAAGIRGRLHSDDYPILEYRWAHGIRDVSILDSPLVIE